jgi:hypothetical protein
LIPQENASPVFGRYSTRGWHPGWCNGKKEVTRTLYTLMQSVRRNGVDVWPYLADVLRRIPAIAPGDTAALEDLLRDRWVAVHPKHRLEHGEEENREAQARRRHKRVARRLAVVQQAACLRILSND